LDVGFGRDSGAKTKEAVVRENDFAAAVRPDTSSQPSWTAQANCSPHLSCFEAV
jgi:hypothetical protein